MKRVCGTCGGTGVLYYPVEGAGLDLHDTKPCPNCAESEQVCGTCGGELDVAWAGGPCIDYSPCPDCPPAEGESVTRGEFEAAFERYGRDGGRAVDGDIVRRYVEQLEGVGNCTANSDVMDQSKQVPVAEEASRRPPITPAEEEK